MNLLFKRLFNLISGLFSITIKEIEIKNPDAILTAALEQKQKNINNLLNAVSRISAAAEEERDRFQKNLTSLQEIESKLKIAVTNKDNNNGIFLLKRKKELQSIVDCDRKSLVTLDDEVGEMEEKLKNAKAKIEKFKVEKSRIISKLAYQKAQREINEIQTLNDSAETRQVNSLRDFVAVGDEKQKILSRLDYSERLTKEEEHVYLTKEFKELTLEN